MSPSLGPAQAAWAPAVTRAMCTGVPFLSIRGAVRKLALLMHPDRVAQFPEARAANGAVLQVLNELQSAARRDAGSDARSDGRSASCRIYYRWDSSPFVERPVGAHTVRLRSEADGQLYDFLVVDVTLAVPAGGVGVRKRRQLVAQQLSDLLASSGVTGVVQARVSHASEAAGGDDHAPRFADADASDDDDALDLEGVPIVSEEKLSSMRSIVREFARGEALARMANRRRVLLQQDVVVGMLRAVANVGIRWEGTLSSALQMRGTRAMQAAFESMGDLALSRMRGSTFVVQGVYTDSATIRLPSGTVSGRGHVMLDGLQPDEWTSLLRSIPYEHARALREMAAVAEERELRSASAGGLAHIIGHDNIISSLPYAAFLNVLDDAVASAEWRERVLPFSSNVALFVVHPSLRPETTVPYTVHATGALCVPLNASRERLLSFVAQNAPRASSMSTQYKRLVDHEDDLVLSCKRSLQLGSLERDACVTRMQMVQSCQRLARMSRQLEPLLRNLNVCVSDRYDVDPEDGTLFIKWDWHE